MLESRNVLWFIRTSKASDDEWGPRWVGAWRDVNEVFPPIPRYRVLGHQVLLRRTYSHSIWWAIESFSVERGGLNIRHWRHWSIHFWLGRVFATTLCTFVQYVVVWLGFEHVWFWILRFYYCSTKMKYCGHMYMFFLTKQDACPHAGAEDIMPLELIILGLWEYLIY